MQWSYAQSGVQIPRVTYTQIEAPNGTEVADRRASSPATSCSSPTPATSTTSACTSATRSSCTRRSTGDVVKVSSLDEPYYASQFAGGRRFDDSAPVAAAPAVAAAAPAAPAVDPTEVAKAQAAVARDAAEVRRQDSALFLAVKAEEATKESEKHRSALFLKAIDPSQVKRPEEPRRRRRRPPVAAGRAAAPDRRSGRHAAPPEAVAAASIDLTNAATDYPGDNASQEELAKWLGKQAEKAGLPPELPVMASLVESGVKNLNHGDADSVGFFQMRVGIWNKGEYAGLSRRSPSCRRSGSSTPRWTSSATRSPRATPTSARTRRTGASGSPTPSGPPSSTATATSCASTRRASCWRLNDNGRRFRAARSSLCR